MLLAVSTFRYAYESYTDPPLHQRFDPESKVLVLSVGFGSVLDYSNSSTAPSRAGWLGWVEAGARGMGLRPNSLWSDYTGMPFVFSNQVVDDVKWCGANAMFAADFDSLIGDWVRTRLASLFSWGEKNTHKKRKHVVVCGGGGTGGGSGGIVWHSW